MEISRDKYLKKLIDKQGNGLIKIVTGVRRCGKSYLLFKIFYDYLLADGIKNDHIIALALDDFKNRAYQNPEKLYDFVASRIVDDEKYFVLLDEIQLASEFESVLNGFLHIQNADVYVTGSNSKFLSSDIITEFRGRGDEIRVYPLNFSEFYSAAGGDKYERWNEYCMYGGMPLVLSMKTSEQKSDYLKKLFNQVYLSDIENRHNIRGNQEINELTNVLASSVGSLTNPLRIANTFESEKKIKITQETVTKYLSYLEDSFLVEKALRYDVKGRKYINTPAKYYFTDVGLRNARLNFRQQEESHIMENIIYNELRIRGFSVDVGVVEANIVDGNGKKTRRQFEIDFVANSGSRRYYIQSALELGSPEKIAQEKNSFLRTKDSFKKIIVHKDNALPWHDDNGILMLGLMDFLLKPESIDW